MSKAAKIWLIIAAALLLVGAALFAGGMTMQKWDFTKLSTTEYETNEHKITEKFESISINTDTADITFIPSEDQKCSVVCYEAKNTNHSVSVKDGALTIKVTDTRKWYEYIGINFSSPKITVYLPAGEYVALSVKSDTGNTDIPKDFSFASIDISQKTGNVKNRASTSGAVKISTTTGNILLENVSVSSLELSTSTGNITASGITVDGGFSLTVSTGRSNLTDINCKNLTSSGSTGDITLKNVIAADKFSVSRSTGDVELDGCDASEITIETDTGDVEGSLLSSKTFVTKSDTGRISVPSSEDGGRCRITTDTGDIKITVR